MESEATALRARPGQWLLVNSFPPERESAARSMGVGIRTGRYHVFQPAGDFDAQTVTEDAHDSTCRLIQVINVYAVFLGGDNGIDG
jgi:hypothetical protein